MNLSMPAQTKKTSSRLLWLACVAAALLIGGASWYYYDSGRMRLEGIIETSSLALSSRQGGEIIEIPVSYGSHVRKGGVLIRFRDAPELRSELLRQEQEARNAAMLVPPHLLFLPGPDGRPESLTGRLERQRADENAAGAKLQAATDTGAQASILYSRASAMVSQGKLARTELDKARTHRDAAFSGVEQARRTFETRSLERAATGTEITRMREMQRIAGADRIPEEARLRNLEEKQARVAELKAALGASVLVAPTDGTVTGILARQGESVAPMQPCIYFQPDGRTPQVRAYLDKSLAAKLIPGQQCRVSLPRWKDIPLDGIISAITPGTPPDAAVEAAESPMTVRISLLIGNADDAAELLALGGETASITVLLRAPLLNSLPAESQTAKKPADQGIALVDPQEPAAPAALPLSVQAPFSEDSAQSVPTAHPVAQPAPVLKAGSPEALGKRPEPENAPAPEPSLSDPPLPGSSLPEAPRLPPMRAPKHLTGSPLPDPGNNPSVTPPHLLEGGAAQTLP